MLFGTGQKLTQKLFQKKIIRANVGNVRTICFVLGVKKALNSSFSIQAKNTPYLGPKWLQKCDKERNDKDKDI